MRKTTYLPPLLLQVLGVAILVFGVVFWAFTKDANALVFGSGMTLISLGSVQGLRLILKEETPEQAKLADSFEKLHTLEERSQRAERDGEKPSGTP